MDSVCLLPANSNAVSKNEFGPIVSGSVRTSRLNPFAPEWRLQDHMAKEDLRCLFLTFSIGFPLSEHQIYKFFTLKYGPCVEKVYVHRRKSGNMMKNGSPLFGKVTFSSSFVPILVLRGNQQARFCIEGRPLWCKKYDPEKLNVGNPTNNNNNNDDDDHDIDL